MRWSFSENALQALVLKVHCASIAINGNLCKNQILRNLVDKLNYKRLVDFKLNLIMYINIKHHIFLVFFFKILNSKYGVTALKLFNSGVKYTGYISALQLFLVFKWKLKVPLSYEF